GRFVTTDIGAAFGFFIGAASFLAFLQRPTWRTAAAAGLLFGLAQLLKFSAVLLVPIDLILLAAWVSTRPHLEIRERLRVAARLIGKSFFAGAIALILIWSVYGALTWNYPQERQIRDAEFLLGSYGFRPAVNFDLALMRHRATRPLGEYLLGVLMVQQRADGGNTAFFLGEVSGAGSRLYFPLLYLLKEPLALHILTLIALIAGFSRIAAGGGTPPPAARLRRWITNHFTEFSCVAVIATYWIISIKSPLNIGVRHILPTFPFIYVMAAIGIIRWLGMGTKNRSEFPNRQGLLPQIYRLYIRPIPKYALVGLLLFWLTSSTLLAFPSFLPYYNELAGGSANGWRVAVDSNYDWGQDLKRLADFTHKNNIQKIAVDYFGGGSPRYYLGERFEPWWSARGPAHGYFAISVSLRQGAWGTPAPGLVRKPEDSYEWLRPYEPIAEIGHSILVYNLP
ncbi:MAG: hypothetical protein AAB915_00950, partial [Patescibacteria group bacterium]